MTLFFEIYKFCEYFLHVFQKTTKKELVNANFELFEIRIVNVKKNQLMHLIKKLKYSLFTAREAPVVEIYPREPQTVRTGESAQLSCRAIAGIPTPTVVWSRTDRAPLSQRVEERYAGTILISNITFSDAGQYECHATNVVGSNSQTAVITVQQPPVIRILPETEEWTITEGDELKLECFAEGSPSPAVEWRKPDRKTGEPEVVHSAPVPFAANSQSLIQKYNADRSDEGTYICHASNEAGEDQKYITVFVQPKRGDVGKCKNMHRIQTDCILNFK